MSDKFTESMEVEAVGNLKPGDIGWGTCDGCKKNIHKFPGVLLQGVTPDVAKLLYEKVEIVSEGTKANMDELEDINKELLDALEDFVISLECYFGYSETDDIQPKNDMAYFIGEYRTAKNLIKKARGLQQ